MDDGIESPCNKICVIEQDSGLCRGCYRTLNEISRWARYSRTEQLALLATIARRKTAPTAAAN